MALPSMELIALFSPVMAAFTAFMAIWAAWSAGCCPAPVKAPAKHYSLQCYPAVNDSIHAVIFRQRLWFGRLFIAPPLYVKK